MKRLLYLLLLVTIFSFSGYSQNSLYVPPTLQGSTISLTLQEGVTQFYPGINTNTMGANGSLLGPTLILHQGDPLSISVDNQLMDTTTIHWHGMHVAPEHDGGPHSIILPGETWNPQFTVLDKAGLYWYHPHLHMMTDMHVSKGIAGLIIVRDTEEAALALPQTYGVDEFPLVLQTKGFDAAGQILVHTNSDTSVMVNGTVNASVEFPAQVVRLRVLNGASQRAMILGFSDNRTFQLIGTDGGLLTAPVGLTRYQMAPGQRADILVDLSSDVGQTLQLMCYGSELPNAIYGAAQPGMGAGATSSLVGYTSNPLNGANYQLLTIEVIAQTASPILTIPTNLAVYSPLQESSASTTRNLTFTPSGAMMNLNGPFVINGTMFDMNTINYTIPLGNTEIWSLTNQTPIAHPFHIHDVQFYILDINGTPPPPEKQGLNDVVLVPAGNGNVRFIAQFNDHSNDHVPYMYHCHMLPHEDMGMMGQFLVVDPASEINALDKSIFSVYPNPTNDHTISLSNYSYNGTIRIYTTNGKLIQQIKVKEQTTDTLQLDSGVYFLSTDTGFITKVVVL